MRNYTVVYNVGKKALMANTKLTVRALELSEDYYVMSVVQANHVEEVFEICNMNHPLDLIESVKVIWNNPAEYPGAHQSMSVGDVLIEEIPASKTTPKSHRYWQVLPAGWKELK